MLQREITKQQRHTVALMLCCRALAIGRVGSEEVAIDSGTLSIPDVTDEKSSGLQLLCYKHWYYIQQTQKIVQSAEKEIQALLMYLNENHMWSHQPKKW